MLVILTVILGALSGISTATIMKKLDNIVKIYSQSLTGKFETDFLIANEEFSYLVSCSI